MTDREALREAVAPTTWVSRPVCATDAMIEAGAAAIRLQYPYMSAGKAWSLAKAVLDAAALMSPRPPTDEDYPEFGAPR